MQGTDANLRRWRLLQLCPKGDWRSLMEPTRQAARQLAQQGVIHITQKGQVRPLNKPYACNACVTAFKARSCKSPESQAGTAVYQGCTAEAPQQQPHGG